MIEKILIKFKPLDWVNSQRSLIKTGPISPLEHKYKIKTTQVPFNFKYNGHYFI